MKLDSFRLKILALRSFQTSVAFLLWSWYWSTTQVQYSQISNLMVLEGSLGPKAPYGPKFSLWSDNHQSGVEPSPLSACTGRKWHCVATHEWLTYLLEYKPCEEFAFRWCPHPPDTRQIGCGGASNEMCLVWRCSRIFASRREFPFNSIMCVILQHGWLYQLPQLHELYKVCYA